MDAMTFSPILALAGAILLIVGELAAFAKMRNVLHAMLLATVAECGFVLMGFGLHTASGWTGALLHLAYQLVMRGLVFLALGVLIRKAGSSQLDRLAGIWQREPFVALAFGFGLFSVMGLSPFKGSFSKFLVLYAAVETGHWALASAGTLASIIAAAYNVYIIQRICFEQTPSTEPVRWKLTWSPTTFGVLALSALTIQMSLFPQALLRVATALASRCPGVVPEYESPWSFLVLLPYVGGFVIFTMGLVSARLRNFAAVGLAAATLYFAWHQPTDAVSWLCAVIFAGICFVVVLYSTSYITGRFSNRYFFLLFLLLGSLLGVATERQFGNFYVFWELMTWSSYLLVIHEQTQDAPDSSTSSCVPPVRMSCTSAFSSCTRIWEPSTWLPSLPTPRT
jgi:formate hydrogenlyase subunit 3/multisubunit Na+/H+ antiporter MnhD subunit